MSYNGSSGTREVRVQRDERERERERERWMKNAVFQREKSGFSKEEVNMEDYLV